MDAPLSIAELKLRTQALLVEAARTFGVEHGRIEIKGIISHKQLREHDIAPCHHTVIQADNRTKI